MHASEGEGVVTKSKLAASSLQSGAAVLQDFLLARTPGEDVEGYDAVALEAAAADNKKFDHSMLCGPPGLGKSQLAQVIAREMGTDLHEVLGQSVTCTADLNALLLEAQDNRVLHIDEVHADLRIGAISIPLAIRRVFRFGYRVAPEFRFMLPRLHLSDGDELGELREVATAQFAELGVH